MSTNIEGGTTKEGIHLGVMAGTLDLVQRHYAGAQIRDSVLYFDPRLPSGLGGLSFRVQFREAPILVTLNSDLLTLEVQSEGASHEIELEYPATSGSCARETGPCSSSARTVPASGQPMSESAVAPTSW